MKRMKLKFSVWETNVWVKLTKYFFVTVCVILFCFLQLLVTEMNKHLADNRIIVEEKEQQILLVQRENQELVKENQVHKSNWVQTSGGFVFLTPEMCSLETQRWHREAASGLHRPQWRCWCYSSRRHRRVALRAAWHRRTGHRHFRQPAEFTGEYLWQHRWGESLKCK